MYTNQLINVDFTVIYNACNIGLEVVQGDLKTKHGAEQLSGQQFQHAPHLY